MAKAKVKLSAAMKAITAYAVVMGRGFIEAGKAFGDGTLIAILKEIDWAAFFKMVMDAFASCQTAGASRRGMENQLDNPDDRVRGWIKLKLKRMYLKGGGSRAKWNRNEDAVVDFAIAQAKAAGKQERDKFFANVQQLVDSGEVYDDEAA